MGVKETAHGLGCMAKGAGCLLAIFAGYLLLQYLGVGLVLGCAYIFEWWVFGGTGPALGASHPRFSFP